MAAFFASALKPPPCGPMNEGTTAGSDRGKPVLRGPVDARNGIGPVLPTLQNAQRVKRPAVGLSGEAGYALTELLVVASLLAIVLGAVLMLGETSQRIAPKETERAMVIREAQVGLDRMTRELREAFPAEAPDITASRAEASVPPVVGGVATRVVYDCDEPHPTEPAYTRCLRYEEGAGGSLSGGEVILDRVLNGAAGSPTPVFVRGSAPATDYVRATVEVAARGDLKDGYDHKILLEDGFYMRNLDAN
jgi:type II secretory pathway pseudopilin PulG